MKIAFLSFYSGKSPRGVETYVHELGNRLSVSHDVVVYQSGRELPLAKYHCEEIPARTIKSFTLRVLARLAKNTDIVIATNGRWQSFLCRFWTLLYGRKMIIPGQSGPGFDDRFNLLCRPDAFVALTEFQKKWAVKNALGVRIEKIPNGVDPEMFNPKVKPAQIDLPKPVFLCAAGLEKAKNIDLTIKAVAGLKQGSLLVMGDGPLRQELEELAKNLGLGGRIKFMQVDHEKMPAYFAASNVVTMAPIPNESFGIVYLEAMASGKPIVAGDDPIRKEIIGEAGILINPKKTEEYAAGLQKALETNWGDLPHHQAEKFFWNKIAGQYEELFKSLK